MQIRKLSHQDIDKFVEFTQAMLEAMASYGGHRLQEPFVSRQIQDSIHTQIESPDRLFLVAELNSPSPQLIGMLEANIAQLYSVFLPKLSLHISAVYVVPQHRHTGIGRSLMETAFDWGREQGCQEADLNVLYHSPAKRLYERLGFTTFQLEMRRTL